MIIDFHAHIYPEKIAAKASESISVFYEGAAVRFTGLSSEIAENARKNGVEKVVVHSAATLPGQVVSINNFIKGECDKYPEFIGFGTMHPEFEDFENELKRIKEIGLKGIKLHPDFQKFQADDERMDSMYDCMAKLKLPVLFHAGDCRFDYSSPKRIAAVYDKHPDLIIIAAHFGGYTQWDETEEYLVGKNVYFDTSSTLWKLSYERANRILKNHGYEKFLFGSDFPMWDYEGELERFNKLDLTEEQKKAVLYDNAVKLFKTIE